MKYLLIIFLLFSCSDIVEISDNGNFEISYSTEMMENLTNDKIILLLDGNRIYEKILIPGEKGPVCKINLNDEWHWLKVISANYKLTVEKKFNPKETPYCVIMLAGWDDNESDYRYTSLDVEFLKGKPIFN